MNSLTVSFVVPCYKLAHLLGDCINSILSQTYTDFEILIMDDCSPDNTPEVASSFRDDRVKHIRNDANLGHLRNYNKGIQLARGRYIWLISADDRLRVPYALERYVKLMEEHPEVGYTFCPGFGLERNIETKLLEEYYYGAVDRIFNGRRFVATVLRDGGGLLSPSVMVRKSCYEQIGAFPLDMPHQGDMYLWFLWALDYDVAYFSEPMVNYRLHEQSMMRRFLSSFPKTVFTDESNVLWRIERAAHRKGFRKLALYIERFISNKYAHAAAVKLYGESCVTWALTVKECDEALAANATSRSQYYRLRTMFDSLLGDKHWHHCDFRKARRSYIAALRGDWNMPKVWAKLLFASMGRFGFMLRMLTKRGLVWPRDSAASARQLQTEN
jgi:glycosyltransferase involved in cell wall biosynthesis